MKTVIAVPRILPDRSEVLCYAAECERGVPAFETAVEIRSPDFDRYRWLTSGVLSVSALCGAMGERNDGT